MFDLILAGDLQTPAHNLVSSVDAQPNGDGRWENGVTFTNHGCFVVNGVCLLCEDTPSDTFDDQDCAPPAEFKPFELDLGTTWATADNFDIIGLTSDDLDIGTSSRLEDLAWSDCEGGDNPTLGSGDSLGAALAPARAIGSMVAAFVDSTDHVGARGTIYMSPAVAFALDSGYIIEEGSKLYTRYGHHSVIVGNFPNTHIAGHIGDPMLFVGDVRVTEAPDEVRRANLRTVRVQRSALLAWNTCAAFVQQVTLA